MAGVQAVYSSSATTVHLYLAGFRPSAKARSLTDAAMCGVSASTEVPPPVGPRLTGRTHVPLEDVLAIEAPLDGNAPRSAQKWCGPCLGRAAEWFGLELLVLHAIHATQRREAT